jgi:Holliday junction DNA helicase RuvA
LPPAELASAIAREDKAAVGRANGVGPKLALRIVTELKGKPIGDGLVQGLSAHDMTPLKRMPSVSGEAVAALMGLGLAEPAARRAVEQAVDRLGAEADISSLIKLALKEMGR